MIFDFDGIKTYLTTKLSSFSDWARVFYFSTYQRLLDVVAYALEKLVYIADFLYNEANWKTSTLRSSLVLQSYYLDYIPYRKKGASGGVEVIADATWEATTPYQYTGNSISIPKWSRISDTNGTIFAYVLEDNIYATGQVSSLEVLIKQGIVKEYVYITEGIANENFSIYSDSIDNDEIEVFVVDALNEVISQITVTEDLRLITDLDNYYCQIVNAQDYQSISFIFGDGISQKKLEPNLRILIKYVETLGVNGEIASSNILTKFVNKLYDSTGTEVILYVKNVDPISDGSDIEDIEEIRTNGRKVFQTGDRCGSINDWKAILEEISYIYRAQVWSETGSYFVNIAALTTSGDNLTTAQKQLIETDTLEAKKSPTEIIQWINATKIYIAFFIVGKIINETSVYVKQALKDLLTATYGYDAVDFMQSVHESNFYRVIDDNQYVDYHETEAYYLESGFEAIVANYQIPNLQTSGDVDGVLKNIIELIDDSLEVWIKRKIAGIWKTPVQIALSSGTTISPTGAGQNEQVRTGEILSAGSVSSITGTVTNLTIKPNSLILYDLGRDLTIEETEINGIGYLSGDDLNASLTNQIDYTTGIYTLNFDYTPSGVVTLDYTQYKPFNISGVIDNTNGIFSYTATELYLDSLNSYAVYGIPNPEETDDDGYILSVMYKTQDGLGSQQNSIRLSDQYSITDIDEDYIFTTLE